MGCTFGLDIYIGTLCIGDGNCDKASSINIQERSHQRQAQREDMDTNFCLEVAGRLKRLAPCKGKCIC